ncbi:TPA: DNA cytosine methyltransferase [Pseudomonas aeruginosa]|nr:DNA cytosine methyltransferase [Pseudomonas aeruginosa]
MPGAYYNEIDPYAAQWLRNLIAAGHIAPGDVDERSIEDVHPDDLKHYTQCHFFAGIGVWSLALRRAGWPDDRSVWTGSCPCQPYSKAGKRLGFADPRHLWPSWSHLIRERRPPELFGEQSPEALVHGWFDLVLGDLEEAGYAAGAIHFAAASCGEPILRKRVYFAAKHLGEGAQGQQSRRSSCQAVRGDGVAKRICALSQTLRYSREIVGLNPSFAAWTMAIPVEWVLCMPSETPSTLKRRRSS